MSDCDCHPQRTNPCPERASLICDPAYYNMLAVPRTKLLGVPVGSNCQAYMTPKRGFLFDDGTGAGQFISEQPQLTLPIINPLSGVTYGAAPGFPFMVIGTGSNPHLWSFVRGQTGVASQLGWNGSEFVFTPAGGANEQTQVCSASNAAAVGLFGCTGTVEDGFLLKKLNAIDTRVVVGAVDGSGNQSFHSLTDSETLKHPLASFTSLRFKTVQELNDDGTDTAGGLPVLAPFGVSAITDGILCLYSPTTHKFYRAPAGYANSLTVGSTSLTTSLAALFTWSSVTINYPNVLVSFQLCTNAAEILTVDVQVDGVTQATFNSQNPAAGGGDEIGAFISATTVVTGITPGSRTITVRVKGQSTGTIVEGQGSITTLQVP